MGMTEVTGKLTICIQRASKLYVHPAAPNWKCSTDFDHESYTAHNGSTSHFLKKAGGYMCKYLER